MNQINEKAGPHARNLTKTLSVDRFVQNKHVQLVSEKTGLDADVLLAAAVILAILIGVLTPLGREIVVTTFVLVYPAWKSFLALQTPGTEDDKKWLTYWITYGGVMILDGALSCITSHIPYWGIVRFVFLISLIHGKTNTYLYVFDYVIKPFFDRFNGEIDTGLTSLDKAADQLVTDGKKFAMDQLQEQLNKNVEQYKDGVIIFLFGKTKISIARYHG